MEQKPPEDENNPALQNHEALEAANLANGPGGQQESIPIVPVVEPGQPIDTPVENSERTLNENALEYLSNWHTVLSNVRSRQEQRWWV